MRHVVPFPSMDDVLMYAFVVSVALFVLCGLVLCGIVLHNRWERGK